MSRPRVPGKEAVTMSVAGMPGRGLAGMQGDTAGMSSQEQMMVKTVCFSLDSWVGGEWRRKLWCGSRRWGMADGGLGNGEWGPGEFEG